MRFLINFAAKIKNYMRRNALTYGKSLKAAALCLSLFVGVNALAQNSDRPGPPPGGMPPQNGQFPGPPPGGFGGGPGGKPGPGGGGSQYVEAKGTKTFDSDAKLDNTEVTSTEADHSAVLATGGTVAISYCTLTNPKDASSTDDASFYGVNAVMCAQPKDRTNGTAVINSLHNKITGSGLGSNGIFAYGKAEINSTFDNITETGGNSRGIMASGGGKINVYQDTVVTKNGSSSCIATDRGGGEINIDGGLYTCYGANSAGLYSTGNINARNATFVSNGGEMMVIEGTNFINATDCHFTSNFDKWGVLLYQSFSGDAEEGDRATLSMKGGSLTYNGRKTGMFYNTNNRDSLYLNNVKIVNKSDTIINVKKGGWGNRDNASRGGTLAVRCDNQTLKGVVAVDKDSKATLHFGEGSKFEGSINPDNTAKEVSFTLDATSKISLTENSYVNGVITLDKEYAANAQIPNIVGNGHNIFYSPEANPDFKKERFNLINGGSLLPIPEY